MKKNKLISIIEGKGKIKHSLCADRHILFAQLTRRIMWYLNVN